MRLRNSLIADVQRRVRVFNLPRPIATYWNARRDKGEPVVFTGWYWTIGASREAGPFKSRSAAYRDAWFRVVQEVEPPTLHNTADAYAAREQRKAISAARRRKVA
jgi:hypothetical protein